MCCVDVCGLCVHKNSVGSACGVESPGAAGKETEGSWHCKEAAVAAGWRCGGGGRECGQSPAGPKCAGKSGCREDLKGSPESGRKFGVQ